MNSELRQRREHVSKQFPTQGSIYCAIDCGERGAQTALDSHVKSFGVKSLCFDTHIKFYEGAFIDYMHLMKNIA